MTSALLALGACADREEPTPQQTIADMSDAESDRWQSASLGPLTYEFDQDLLTAVDIEIDLPPNYQTTHRATKLISEERADNLGEDSCTYGESGLVTECDASKENGLALALLPRPIEEYRASFVTSQAAANGEDLEPATLDSARGFSYTAEAEGAGTEYQFFEMDGRTIMLSRRFDENLDPRLDEAMDGVIASIEESLDRRHGLVTDPVRLPASQNR